MMHLNATVVFAGLFGIAVILTFNVVSPPPLDLTRSPASDVKNNDGTMKAIAYRQHGNASVLELYESVLRPKLLRDGQVLIRVMASSLNPCDFKLRRSPLPSVVWMPLPKIPGEDIAGIVVEVMTTSTTPSSSNNPFRVGDRVAAMMPILGSRFGAHAEYAVVHESMIAKLPPIDDDDDMMIDEGDKTRMISFVEAASLPLISLTTMQAFSKLTSHTEGKKILIHAGAGGVGTFAIQYAKKVLHMYVATTASIEKAHFLKQLGADLVIDYRTTDFQSVIQDYDVVFDTMSWAYEDQTLASSRSEDDDKRVLKSNGGHYLNILSSDWGLTDGKEKANGFLMVRHFLYYKLCHLVPWWRETVPSYDIVVVKPNGKQLQKVLNLVHDGTIRPIIDQTFPLKDAVSAYQYLENGHASGKVVLEH